MITGADWVEYIEAVRSKNNKLWMGILRIALKHAPQETKPLLKEIRTNDLLISEAVEKIADEDQPPKDWTPS